MKSNPSIKEQFPHQEFPQTQRIHFANGQERVIRDIIHIERGKWTHLITEDNEYIINPDQVLFIQVISKPSN